ncbi:hypothetical protein [uncultured Helicobacter sp.]|uniref:hypothetical protein n=2 Tax=uncultured Helicobacter sp. TaxID=175537 RepID=UPI001C3B50F1|nr:hypothetical protein [Candidatus Helicobacter avicola]
MMRESVQILEKKIFIKRDDLLDFGITGFNGNKARKFLSLLDSQYEVFVSFGGNQSNAMQVLAALAKARGKEFFYITSEPPKFLRTNPMGNFAFGLAHNVRYVFAPAGSRVEVLENLAREVFAQQYKRYGERALFIPQGGSEELAMRGMRELVRELCEMIESKASSDIAESKKSKALDSDNVWSRSGASGDLLSTSDTNLLQANCNKMIESLSTGGVIESRESKRVDLGNVCTRSGGNGGFAPIDDTQEQRSCNTIMLFITAGSGVSARSFVRAQCEMRRECENGQCESKNAGDMELITLCCAGEIGGVGRTLCADFAFGSLQAEVWAMYHKLLAQGIEFDLLYDCVGFVLLERALEQGYFSDEDLAKPWVFVHSGGLLGNASQILRYERKFGVSFLHAQKIPHKKNPL